MPNKYNLGAINVKFNPSTIKQNDMIILEIDDSHKKEPVMQIEDNNKIQLLYYYGRVFIYKLGNKNFFVIEMTCEKGPQMYFMFDVDVVVSSSATHNNSSMGILLAALNGTENNNKTVGLNLNSELSNQKIQRSGNIFYVKNIKVSSVFPLASVAKTAFLPQALKGMDTVPTAGETVQFVQEEIQWVLDCQYKADSGEENVDTSSDKTALTYFITGIVVCVVVVLVYLFVMYVCPKISKKSTTSRTWSQWWNDLLTGNVSGQISLISSGANTNPIIP